MYLVDTNVVSELRRSKPHGAVLEWFKRTPERNMTISSVTAGEIQAGIEITRERDPLRALEIETWLNALLANWAVIEATAEDFRLHAKLMHGKSDDIWVDALIAAMAQNRNLTVVTRNTKDFKSLGLQTFNPFKP